MTGEQYIKERDGLMEHHNMMRPFWSEAELLTSPLRSLDNVKDSKANLRLIKQVSAVATLANTRLADGCLEWITPEAGKWWKWTPITRGSSKVIQEKFFLECTEVARDLLRQTNFYTEMHRIFLQRGQAGTVGLYAQEGDPAEGEPLLSFEPWSVTDYQCAEDRFGRLHCIYRTLRLSALKAGELFGDDKLPEQVRLQLNSNEGHKEAEYVHVVRRRTVAERREGKDAPGRKAWASLYIDPITKQILKESGQDEQRVFSTRWLRWDTRSPYGISPAMMCLADIRGINHQEMLLATLGELAVDPRILVPVGHQGPIDLGPRGVTQFTDPANIPREWAPAGDYRVGTDTIERRSQSIRAHFLNGVFAMFDGLEREVTAYEVASRREENMTKVAPAAGLLNVDLIQPCLEAVFMTALRANLFPEVPEELIDRGPTGTQVSLALPVVAQTNRMTRALANETQAGLTDWMNTLAPAAELFGAGIYDAVNLEKAGRLLAVERGLPAEIIRSDEEEKKVKADRQAAQEEQQNAALMLEASKSPAIAQAGVEMLTGRQAK